MKVLCFETSTITRTWWVLIAGKSSSYMPLPRLRYKAHMYEVRWECYLGLGKRYNVVRPIVGKLNSSSLFDKVFITNRLIVTELWAILWLPTKRTYDNTNNVAFKSRTRINILLWKLYHRLLMYTQSYDKIFRTIATIELEIHIILYL